MLASYLLQEAGPKNKKCIGGPASLLCAKTSVYYGEYMVKNARDQGPGRNNQGLNTDQVIVFIVVRFR